jgi:hypothetical protein
VTKFYLSRKKEKKERDEERNIEDEGSIKY